MHKATFPARSLVDFASLFRCAFNFVTNHFNSIRDEIHFLLDRLDFGEMDAPKIDRSHTLHFRSLRVREHSPAIFRALHGRV
jgi:hypothetical protein